MITFREIWNEAVSRDHSTKEFKPRNYLYASELGGPIYDIWHRMKGIEPTTPPNDRSFRKFNAGNTWEWIVKMVLWNAGVLEAEQTYVESEGKLPIHGRLDFILNKGSVKTGLDFDAPEYLRYIIQNFEVRDFDRMILEIKSVGSYIFPMREKAPAENHRLQLGFYTRELELPGLLTYISKDDCLLAEHPISETDKDIQRQTHEFVDMVYHYLDADQKPPLEPLIIKEEKFSKNWRVEYSGYLDHYGFETPEEYRQAVDSKISRWNRVLKRMEEGKDMTDNNKEALEEMRLEGWKV